MSDYREMHEFLTEQLKQIARQRNDIKEQYIAAWLAASVHDDDMAVGWIIRNVELVETQSADRREISWHLRLKKEIYESKNHGDPDGARSSLSDRLQAASQSFDWQGSCGHSGCEHDY